MHSCLYDARLASSLQRSALNHMQFTNMNAWYSGVNITLYTCHNAMSYSGQQKLTKADQWWSVFKLTVFFSQQIHIAVINASRHYVQYVPPFVPPLTLLQCYPLLPLAAAIVATCVIPPLSHPCYTPLLHSFLHSLTCCTLCHTKIWYTICYILCYTSWQCYTCDTPVTHPATP